MEGIVERMWMKNERNVKVMRECKKVDVLGSIGCAIAVPGKRAAIRNDRMTDKCGRMNNDLDI